MDFTKFGEALSRVLPKIKTQLQLSGLAIGLVCALAVHFAAPGNNVALLTAGGVGVSFLIFGQLFNVLTQFRAKDRAMVFLVAFLLFCIFTICMVVLTLRLLSAPQLTVSPYNPEEDPYLASSPAASPLHAPSPVSSASPSPSPVSSASPVVLVNTTLPNSARNVDYRFSDAQGVPRLRGIFKYVEDSRALRYPNADFHNDVSWGSPWLSLGVNNPTDTNLLITSMAIEAVSIKPINDLIIVAGEINAETKPVKLRMGNQGWGSAADPTLTISFGVGVGDAQYRLIAPWSQIKLQAFEREISVDLSDVLPDRKLWHHYREGTSLQCDVVAVLGRLTYHDDSGQLKTESFRASAYAGRCVGGGNIGPSAVFNVEFPTDATAYPINVDVSDCVAARSAGRFLLHMTAQRSARFKLRVSLRSTSNVVLEKLIDVEILVPRGRETMRMRQVNTFIKGPHGCT